jgi:hypothetical protein
MNKSFFEMSACYKRLQVDSLVLHEKTTKLTWLVQCAKKNYWKTREIDQTKIHDSINKKSIFFATRLFNHTAS